MELIITNLGTDLIRYFRYILRFMRRIHLYYTYAFISDASTCLPSRIKRKNFQIYFNPISSIRLQALLDLNRLFKDTENLFFGFSKGTEYELRPKVNLALSPQLTR
jgi:hypothetical protein